MTISFIEAQCQQIPEWQQQWQSFQKAQNLPSLVYAALQLGLLFARIVLEAEAGKNLRILLQVQAYFQRHQAHIRYQAFDKQQMPLGSGMVESACKWLIEQRFKGVGMRWSEPGLQHLLILRVAWVNQRFDDCFPLVPKSPLQHPSHNT